MIRYKLFLTAIESIGHSKIKQLIEYFGNEEEIWKASLAQIDYSKILTDNQFKEYERVKNHWDIEYGYENVKSKNVKTVFYGDENYPKRLNHISNPPYCLFYKGGLPDNNKPTVAIVGARNCSEYGRNMAGYYASGLASRGIQIISGMASGIDGIAGREAIKYKRSYAVLGCSADICYPISNKSLYDDLCINGGVISEYYPGTKPIAHHFPIRNRIISGLADVVLVIEAKEQSGTMITVNMALEQGKEIYAVPGRVCDALSSGCNRLISEGAGVATTIDSIASYFEERQMLGEYENNTFELKKYIFTDGEKILVKYLKNKAYCIDELYMKVRDLGIEELSKIESISTILFSLQLKDVVEVQSGQYCIKGGLNV